MPRRIKCHQFDRIRKHDRIYLIKCFMWVCRFDQFADIYFSLLFLMNLQMRTYEIRMRMCLDNAYNFSLMALSVIVIRPSVSRRIYKYNYPINEDSIRKMRQSLVLKLLNFK